MPASRGSAGWRSRRARRWTWKRRCPRIFGGGGRHVAGGPVQHLADGHPDMQGFWNAANNGGAVFELQNIPHRAAAVLRSGKGAIVDPADGLLPYQPWAAAKAKDTFENHWRRNPSCTATSRCAEAMYVQFGFQIFQPANYVVLTWEFMHAVRIIPTDGRPHIPASIKLFMGDSVGHWEGDTLVVDTTNLTIVPGTTPWATSIATPSTLWSASRRSIRPPLITKPPWMTRKR